GSFVIPGLTFLATGLHFFFVTTPFLDTIPSAITDTTSPASPNNSSIVNPGILVYALRILLFSISNLFANPGGKSLANAYSNASILSCVFLSASAKGSPSLLEETTITDLLTALYSKTKA